MLANTVNPVIAQFETPTLNFTSNLLKQILDYQEEIKQLAVKAAKRSVVLSMKKIFSATAKNLIKDE